MDIPRGWTMRCCIHPNAITVVGTILQCVVGLVFSWGFWLSGGMLLIFASLFDILDGFVARRTGKVSAFGAFLDSTLDRVSDMAILGGIAVYFFARQDPYYGSLAVYCAVTSVLISYAKARAENMIEDCGVGVAQRGERIVLVILGALVGFMQPALWVLGVLNTLTLIHRIVHTFLRSASFKEGKEPVRANSLAKWFLDFGRWTPGYWLLSAAAIISIVFSVIIWRF